MKPWMRELISWAPGYVVFGCVALVCVGFVFATPDRPAPAWRVRIAELERENAELRLLLDQQRRAEGKPFVPTADNIAPTSLPTGATP